MLLTKNKRLRQVFGALETANFLSLKLLIKNRKNLRLYPGRVFREYMNLVKYDQWMCKSIFDIFPEIDNYRITLEHIPERALSIRAEEQVYLALIAKALKPKCIFEIGTFRGRSALNFALNCPDDCKIYTLDLLPDDRQSMMDEAHASDAMIIENSLSGIHFKGTEVAHKIYQLYGNSLEFDYSPYHDKIDIVYVDGAHHYRAVKSDTLNALKMIKPGGVIIWDDFANYGDYNDVTRAVLDCLPSDQVTQIENAQLAVYRSPAEL